MRAAWSIACGSVVCGVLLLSCTVESRTYSGSGGPPPVAASGGSSGTTSPLLVDVDTNRTMIAQPGDGVGVFTEYAAGGHWHVFWTCDTNRTNFDCRFNVGISTDSPITNASGVSLDTTDQLALGQMATGKLSADAQTAATIKGLTFDTAPGAAITLDAQVDGQRDGAFLFFVQDGQVNGGYAGTLTDPLMLEPSNP